MSLCALESKTNVSKFAISTRTALKLGIQALRNYLKLTCECELLALPNAKVNVAKDHGKNHMNIRLLLICHL